MALLAMPCWFYDKDQIRQSPSIADGLGIEHESRYRRLGARFIIDVGTKMGLRYDTIATGVVYFHRFYMFHSFRTFPRYIVACCCLFLAGKVEETPKKCKDVIRISKSILTDAQFAQFGDDPKEEVMTLERILLQTIKFDLQVDHPYGHLLRYAKCLECKNSEHQASLHKMVQMAWTFINDSLCTTLCLQWEPEVIAIALMYLAGKLSQFEVNNWIGRTSKHSHWWDLYVEGMSLELLEDICHQVLDLYSLNQEDVSQASPPATPPTKSTIRKVPPVASSSAPSTSPAAEASPVPGPEPKAKDIPVGQPIPRLEPGELKRKTAKITTRKESTEGKTRFSSSASKPKKRRVSGASQPAAVSEIDAAPAEPDVSDPSSKSTAVLDSSAYQNPVGQYSKITTTTDIVNTPVSQTQTPTVQNQYMASFTRPGSFLPAEGNASYFPANQPVYVQNASYLQPPPLPSAAPVSSGAPAQPPASIQPPLPPHPNQAPYPEAYGTQVAPNPPPFQHMPQIHSAPPVSTYPPPPAQPPPPPNIVLPNVAVPPPPPPSAVTPPMPHMRMPPGPARSGMPNPAPVPPIILPPSPVPPRHYGPRPEHESFNPRDNRMNRDHLPRMGGHMPRLPPRFFFDGPPPPPDFARGHYDQDRPSGHFRHGGDMDYEQDHPHEEGYSDNYNSGHPPPPGAFRHDGPPFRGYGPDRGLPPPRMNMPLIKNPPALLEAPTGIAPVRITGRKQY